MPVDLELIGLLIALMAPIYAGLWKLLQDSVHAQDEIKQLKNDLEEFKRCRYCHRGIEPGSG